MIEVITDNNVFLPDGVTPNPNYGTVTTIIHPDPPTYPKVLTKTEFQKHCHAQLGGGSVGLQRYGEILKNARSSTIDVVVAVMEYYDDATSTEKPEAANMIAIFVGVGLATQTEADAVINNWPVA